MFTNEPRKHTPHLVGVVHLPPLPGSPTPSSDLAEVIRRAVYDARQLVAGGVDGMIIENFGDAPFTANQVGPFITAMMTRVICEVRQALPEAIIGVNVLRNDADSALATAIASDASFIRVNVHTGTMMTDQGTITGNARTTLLNRQRFGQPINIAADVHVKHAVPFPGETLLQAAKDTYLRGHADALIITGSGTGQPVDAQDLTEIAAQLPEAPLWIGSGLTPKNAHKYLGLFDTAIVGTWLHRDGDIKAPIDATRVETMRRALQS